MPARGAENLRKAVHVKRAMALALALGLAACDVATLPPPTTGDAASSPYLEAVVRGRTNATYDMESCDRSGFSGAILDVLWARSHADPAHKEEIDQWLASVGFDFFLRCYEYGAKAIATMPSYAPWHRVEADYTSWLSAHPERMLAKIYAGDECRSERCVPFHRRWPGFDQLAAGLPVVDRWERSGHTGDELADVVVCPRPLGRYGVERRCGWFRHAMGDPEATRHLAEVIGKYDDPVLVRAVVENSGGMPPEGVVALWRALDPWPRMWREAGVAAADTLMEDHAMQVPLLDEARRAYATPEHRDVALYVLGRDWTWGNERGGYFVQPWDKFPAEYGGPISMVLFARLLEVSPHSVDLVPIVWPALAKGHSRVKPLLDHLDAYLDGTSVSERTLRKIAGTVCRMGDAHELAELHEWLVRRSKPGSAHEDDVGYAALSTMPGHCTALM
jgi:hypothetical protein